MGLQAAITYLQGQIAAISGIRGAPEYVQEDSSVFPFVNAYVGPGRFTVGDPAGDMKYLGSIIVDLHLARKDLPRDVSKVMTYHESIPLKLCADTTLGGVIDTFGYISTTGLVAMQYGAQETLGIRFTVQDVKFHSALP